MPSRPTTSSSERSRHRPTRTSGPTPSGAGGGPADWRGALSSRVGEARLPRRPRRRRPGVRADLVLEELMDAGVAGEVDRGVVPLDQQLLALRRREQRSSAMRRLGSRRRCPPAASSKWPSHAGDRGGSNRSVAYSMHPGRPSGLLGQPASGRTWPVPCRSSRRALQPGQRQLALGDVLEREHHLEQRDAAQIRSGRSSSTRRSKGMSWWA